MALFCPPHSYYTACSCIFRLTATSWNLAQNKSSSIVGFSGTNDNHRILPLQVRQYSASKNDHRDPILNDLDGTNGKMLQMMMEHTVAVRQLGIEARNSHLLINIIKDGVEGSMQMVHALIDCGALLAGTDLHDFSKCILALLPLEAFGGVTFFCGEKSNESKNWVVLERSGRLLHKDISPIKESETFVIFDEPRCRGTDLKLRSDAIGLLTLAPKICKDKIMQAAGRLRNLGRNQKLVIAGRPDVFSKLHGSTNSSSGLSRGQKDHFEATVSQVLLWAMKNTVEATSEGLFNWANQGLFFSSTFGKDPKFCITEEVLKLEDMYGKSFTEETVSKHINDAHQYHMKRTGGKEALHSSVKGMVDLILEQVDKYGRDFTISTRGCDEECERELQMENEQEEVAENEVPSMKPMSEKPWPFKTALTCRNPLDLPPIVGVKWLGEFVEKFVEPNSLAKIRWSKKIYLTNNFAHTVVCPNGIGRSALNSFLRVVNFVLFFLDGSILLLSEFEGNSLLKLLWDSPAAAPSAFGASTPAFFAPVTIGAFDGAPAADVFGQPLHQQRSQAGTIVTQYQATIKQDGMSSNIFQAITAMPQYEHKSFEEVRLDDYMAGNKVGVKFLLLHSGLLRQSLDSMSEVPFIHTLLPYIHTIRASGFISEESMATMQLFNGETTYGTEERKKALRSILHVRKTHQGTKFCPRAVTERLVEMRGNGKLYPYSDLETLCEKLLCEISFDENYFAARFSKWYMQNQLEKAKPESHTAVASVAAQNLFAIRPASVVSTPASFAPGFTSQPTIACTAAIAAKPASTAGGGFTLGAAPVGGKAISAKTASVAASPVPFLFGTTSHPIPSPDAQTRMPASPCTKVLFEFGTGVIPAAPASGEAVSEFASRASTQTVGLDTAQPLHFSLGAAQSAGGATPTVPNSSVFNVGRGMPVYKRRRCAVKISSRRI
jgi:hypothetical protein